MTVNGPIKTGGNCSPAIVQPQGKVLIECNVIGLSKADADQLLRNGTKVLQALRNADLKSDQILTLLQQVASDTAAVRATAQDRHLEPDQRAKITDALRKFPDTRIVVEMSQGESADYGKDWITAFQTAGLTVKPTDTLFRLGSFDEPGVHLLINADDNVQHTISSGCVALNDALKKLSIIDLPDGVSGSRVPRGACLLYVGRKNR